MNRQMFMQLLGALLLLAAVAAIPTWRSASSQDDDKHRIDVLEARVTLLEATVAAIVGTPEPPAFVLPTPTATPTGTYTLAGEIYVIGSRNGEDYVIREDGCQSNSEDFYTSVGSKVEVTDRDGTLLATGTLEDSPNRQPNECRFAFAIDVPWSATYVVSPVRRTGHDKVLTFEELEAADWHVDLWISTSRLRWSD